MRSHGVLVLLAAGACARGTVAVDDPDAGPGGGTDASRPDGAAPSPDAAPSDAPPQGVAAALVLTELVLAPSTAEFIELANPSAQPVSLADYYLSDAGAYFQLPGGAPSLDPADFIVRFPAGAMIPAHGVITVAFDTAASFTTVYGVAPTYSIAGGTMTTVAANGVPSLTNGGELVVLFRWDGQGDLVRDVDLVIAGVPTTANGLVDKSGAMVDGPDVDAVTSSYRVDARTIGAQPTAPAANKSTKRIVAEAGHQLQTGAGNGIDGDDETSENTAMTWDTAFTAPTPGAVPTGLVP